MPEVVTVSHTFREMTAEMRPQDPEWIAQAGSSSCSSTATPGPPN
jgi:hypothetical protein